MKYFAVAPGFRVALPNNADAQQVYQAISLLGHQCADAEEAVEMFEEDRAVMLGQRHTDTSAKYGRADAIAKYSRRIHAHARTFVFAVDNFIKMIERLIEDSGAQATALR